MRQILLEVQYCEDIRREASGRVSLMGLFPGVLRVKASAPTVKRLKLHALAWVPDDRTIDSALLRVVYEGETIKEVPLKEETMKGAKSKSDANNGEGSIVFGFITDLTELGLTAPGTVQTYFCLGDEEAEGMPLQIEFLSP